ncbi:hypothetical protein, partial [Wolbachia endosymbiont of Drosophila yakuba]|uniref:hypothetical protein n=1 Tax=Wolbachia endosymbiont of Drosophila yakuba TaxID=260915 RepID=UPI001C554369
LNGYFIMNFVSSHQIFSVAMQQSYPSVGYLDKRHCPPGRPKLQCPYSYGFIRGIDSANE